MSDDSRESPEAALGRFAVTGKVALVTGASSGLGRRFAQVLDAAGATVIAVARRRDQLDELAAGGRQITAMELDVADSDRCVEVVEQILAEHGRIDILVNNAGIARPARSTTADLDEFRRVIEVNLVAVFHLSRLVAPSMRDHGGGSIINVGSVHSVTATWPGQNASYASTKHAVSGLSKELACTWARHGVRVNTLAPGYFRSEMGDEALDDDRARAVIYSKTPMGRHGEESELDGALLFLASDASTFCTGQTVCIDGGWTAH